MNVDQLDRLVGYLGRTRLSDLPEAVVKRAGQVIADVFGVTIYGATAPDVNALAARFPASAEGATAIGFGKRMEPLHAILVNASAAATQELTEGNRFARGHLAVQVLPAILAQAETSGSRGADVLTAFVVAYELAARIGLASKRFYEVYGHGTWGVLGSAVACARLRGYQEALLRESLLVASSLSLAPLFETHFAGATVRNTYAGVGGMIGWTAADLAEAGFLGLESGIERTFGQILGSEFDAEIFMDGLGSDYLIERNYFKFHACGRHMHPTLDAFERILASEEIPLGAIAGIDVETYYPASRKKARQVRTSVDAKVSIPYALASRLVFGTSSAPAYAPAALRDETVQQLMQLVSVAEDPAMTAVQPGLRQAHVRVTLRDGRVLEQSCNTQPRGEFDEPLEEHALQDKFNYLVSPQLGAARASDLWKRLTAIHEEPNVAALMDRIGAVTGHSQAT